MCKRVFPCRSQHDFHCSTESRKGSKMDSKVDENQPKEFTFELRDLIFQLRGPILGVPDLKGSSLSNSVSKKGAVKLTFGSLFGPFLGPWGHLESIWEVRDLKKDDLGATRFRVTFLHRNWTHQNVQKRVPVEVSARFSLFH